MVVFDSANPDFFIPHVDMKLIDDWHALDEVARDVPAVLHARRV